MSKTLKFLATVRDLRTSATRSRIAYAVWGGRRGIAAWNSVLDLPEMAGMVTTKRHQRRGRKGKMRRGRPSLRYALTRAGHKMLRELLKAQAIADAAIQKALQDDQEAVQRARHDDLARKAQEKAQAVMEARAKQPNAPRHRSAADRAARQRFFDNKMLEQGRVRNAEGKYKPLSEVQAVEGIKARLTEPYVEPQRSALGDADYIRNFHSFVSLSRFTPPMATPGTTALLKRIASAGYQVKEGRVLYGGNWISPEEWRAKMPHVEL
jgi:DNA-binding PadR family transcriptional regulator